MTSSTNKRSRDETEESIAATMARCLMHLSHDRGEIDYQSAIQHQQTRASHGAQNRVYECKTCNKQFPSFQALGGHRTSHKTRRLMELYSSENRSITYNQQQAKKQKIHECSICGLKFATGQALGGHMRRHRAAMIGSGLSATATTGLASMSSDIWYQEDITRQKEELPQVPVLNRSNSSRRVLGLNLDLSLSLLPLDSSDFEFSTTAKGDKHMSSTPSMIYSFI